MIHVTDYFVCKRTSSANVLPLLTYFVCYRPAIDSWLHHASTSLAIQLVQERHDDTMFRQKIPKLCMPTENVRV